MPIVDKKTPIYPDFLSQLSLSLVWRLVLRVSTASPSSPSFPTFPSCKSCLRPFPDLVVPSRKYPRYEGAFPSRLPFISLDSSHLRRSQPSLEMSSEYRKWSTALDLAGWHKHTLKTTMVTVGLRILEQYLTLYATSYGHGGVRTVPRGTKGAWV